MTSDEFTQQKQAVNQGLGVFKKRMADAGFDEKKHQVDGVRWCFFSSNPASAIRFLKTPSPKITACFC
jgi:hypothetical protein